MGKFVPTVVFDFDGVIHSYKSGWKGVDVIPDPPVPGIRKAIAELRAAGYRVVVVSTRCAKLTGMAAINRFLKENDIVVDDITAHKPPALCYIDDRALCFDGDAAGLLAKVQGFKPWYQQSKAFVPGQAVWVIERPFDGEFDSQVCGYIYLATVAGAVLVTPFIYGRDTLEDMVQYCLQSTASSFSEHVYFFPMEDCYTTAQEAEEALAKETEA